MSENIELVGNGSRGRPNGSVGGAYLPKYRPSIAYPHEVTLGTSEDPYNKEELEHTLKGRELWLFVLFYTCCVLLIVLMFESFMPVLFNPNYPNDP